MKIYIDSLLVLFPYDFIYPEQLEYMRSLKEGLDRRGHVMLEMPSGTGKTISILSLVVAYWARHSTSANASANKSNQKPTTSGDAAEDADATVRVTTTKLERAGDGDGQAAAADERIRVVYCTRTVAEMVKTADELRRLVAYWHKHMPGSLDAFTAVCLSARKNLCANADVAKFTYGQEVDAACRHVTSEWSTKKCPLFANIDIEDLVAMNTKSSSSRSGARAGGRGGGGRGGGGVGGAAAGGGDNNGAASVVANANLNNRESKIFVPPGVHDVNALMKLGLDRGVCPYLMSRHAVQNEADLVISSFLYIVDPKVSPAVTQHMPRQTVVILDEGHNVDDVCIEALSMIVTRADTSVARDHNVKELEAAVGKMKADNRQRLADEFQRIAVGRDLVPAAAGGGGCDRNQNAAGQLAAAHLALIPAEILDQAVPAQLKQLNHFLPLLSRIVEFFHRFICRMTFAQVADPVTFLSKVRDECQAEIQGLRFLSGRLSLLLQTLQIDDLFKFRHVVLIADFVTTLAAHVHAQQQQVQVGAGTAGMAAVEVAAPDAATAVHVVSAASAANASAAASAPSTGAQFAVVCEPFDNQNPTVPDPVLQLACLDASLAMRDVFERFDSVVLTSGTLSPLYLPAKILGFTPVVSRSLPMTLSRRCVAPLIVTRSANQASLEDIVLSSSFKVRKDATVNRHVVQAYASLLLNLARVTPDGIVAFFTGYAYMNEVLSEWHANGFLKTLSEHKLIFIETQGVEETARCLANFRRACDIGRGAIFFSIARGKIAEGIDFDRHYGRAVVMFGVPYLPPVDRALNERLKWMQTNLQISDQEYRSFDAMRQASQCIGRVIRNKTDYGLMILVDRRLSRPELRRKLPEWIAACVESNGNLSTEGAVSVAKRFFREMAQPWDKEKEMGNTLLDAASVAARGFDVPQAVAKTTRVAIGAVVATAAAAAAGGGDRGGGGRVSVVDDDAPPIEVGAEFKAARAPGEARKPTRRGRSPS